MDMVDKIKSVEEWFKDNYLDGDEVQDGQMLSSKECLDDLTKRDQQLLDAVCEVLEGLEIVSKPELKMVNPHIQTWEDGYRFALDDAKSAIKKLLDDNK